MSGASVHAFTTLDALAEANAQIGMARINANLAHSAATTACLASIFKAFSLIDRRSKHAAVRLAEQAHKRAEGTNPAAPPFEHNNLKQKQHRHNENGPRKVTPREQRNDQKDARKSKADGAHKTEDRKPEHGSGKQRAQEDQMTGIKGMPRMLAAIKAAMRTCLLLFQSSYIFLLLEQLRQFVDDGNRADPTTKQPPEDQDENNGNNQAYESSGDERLRRKHSRKRPKRAEKRDVSPAKRAEVANARVRRKANGHDKANHNGNDDANTFTLHGNPLFLDRFNHNGPRRCIRRKRTRGVR